MVVDDSFKVMAGDSWRDAGVQGALSMGQDNNATDSPGSPVGDGQTAEDNDVFVEYYPTQDAAGAPLDDRQYGTLFDRVAAELREVEVGGGCGPFRSEDDWRLAQWIVKNIGQGKADELLALNMVSMRLENGIDEVV